MLELRWGHICPGLPCPQCMAQHRTRQADYRTIDPLQKTPVQHPLHFYPIEILAVYRVGNLRRKEPERQILRPAQSDTMSASKTT